MRRNVWMIGCLLMMMVGTSTVHASSNIDQSQSVIENQPRENLDIESDSQLPPPPDPPDVISQPDAQGSEVGSSEVPSVSEPVINEGNESTFESGDSTESHNQSASNDPNQSTNQAPPLTTPDETAGGTVGTNNRSASRPSTATTPTKQSSKHLLIRAFIQARHHSRSARLLSRITLLADFVPLYNTSQLLPLAYFYYTLFFGIFN